MGTKNYVLHNSLLEYTIHFQNTGTDTAYVVNIADTINPNLDLGTLQIIGSSHTVSSQIKDSRTVIFSFNKINLPPLTTNEPASNGYVKYSIKPKSGLSDNTQVTNSASIYFDYNPPILTDTTSNMFVSVIPNGSTGNNVITTDNGTSVYPNPTSDGINIITSLPTELTLYSFNGQTLLESTITTNTYIPLTGFLQGVYFLKLTNAKGAVEQKLIKK